jgi:membrane protease YdiL (CAAX protease family)
MNIFYNPAEKRLRAFWRLLIEFFIGYLGLGMINLLAVFVIAFLLILTAQIPFGLLNKGQQLMQALNAAFNQFPLLFSLRSLMILAFIVLAYRMLARWVDRRSWRDYGFHFDPSWWRDLGFGLFLGAALVGMVFGIEILLGWVTVTGTLENSANELPFWPMLLSGLFSYLLVGVSEELLVRGYPIKNLAEGLNLPPLNPKAAVLITYLLTSLVFGLLHADNPNATLISTVNLILAGLFLGLGFILTGELAIPIGLHISWNFFMGYVFGYPVSGVDQGVSLLASRPSGPALWTGGEFGPEGGILAIFILLLGILIVYSWIRLTHGQARINTTLAEYVKAKQKAAQAASPMPQA